jgi:hypothetical protein
VSPTSPIRTVGYDRTLTSPGGTVVARCMPSGAYLVLWSPAPGFEAGDVLRGPTSVARVSFETTGQEVNLRITCVDLVPQSSYTQEWSSGFGH